MPTFFKLHKKNFMLAGASLLFIFCLVIANIIASSVISVSKPVKQVKSSPFQIYMLSMGKSQVKNEALSLAKDYQKIGAGGYIWEKDNYFYVISSAYLNKNDAANVQNSIKNKGIESELVSADFKSMEINGNFNDEEARVLAKAINSFENYYQNLYDIAISYDTLVYNEISARVAVNNAYSTFSSYLANFETIFEDNCTTKPLENLHKTLNLALSSGKSLCSAVPLSEGQTYSSLIKYYYLEILNNFYGYLNGN